MYQSTVENAAKQKIAQDNYAKGAAFEGYITRLFNSHHFYLKKWRKSEKFTDTFFKLDHYYPDLELELVFTGTKKYRFAVECKWREEFKDGKIKWASDSQICSYQMFQDQVRIPVFVAIGIGGSPENPEKLFVTPLNNICNFNEVYESNLIRFERKPTHRFYYDFQQLKLF